MLPFLLLVCSATLGSPTPLPTEPSPRPVQSFADAGAESVWRALSERAAKLDRFAVTLEIQTTSSDEAFAQSQKRLLDLATAERQARGEILTDREREDLLVQIVKKRVTRLYVAKDGEKWRTTFTMVHPSLIVHRKGYDVVVGFEEDAACDGVEARRVVLPKGPARITLPPGDDLHAVYPLSSAVGILAGTAGLIRAENEGVRWRLLGRELVNGTECVILEGTLDFQGNSGVRWRYSVAPRLGFLPLKMIHLGRKAFDGSRSETTMQVKQQLDLSPGVWIASLSIIETRKAKPSVGPINSTSIIKIARVHSLRKPLSDEHFQIDIPPEMPIQDMRGGAPKTAQ